MKKMDWAKRIHDWFLRHFKMMTPNWPVLFCMAVRARMRSSLVSLREGMAASMQHRTMCSRSLMDNNVLRKTSNNAVTLPLSFMDDPETFHGDSCSINDAARACQCLSTGFNIEHANLHYTFNIIVGVKNVTWWTSSSERRFILANFSASSNFFRRKSRVSLASALPSQIPRIRRPDIWQSNE